MGELGVLIPILALAIPVTAIVFNGLIKLGEMQQPRRELGETQERLDFAERLLAKPRDDARP